jgi:hypothetical protein
MMGREGAGEGAMREAGGAGEGRRAEGEGRASAGGGRDGTGREGEGSTRSSASSGCNAARAPLPAAAESSFTPLVLKAGPAHGRSP